jgi:hypothetical protein
MRTAATGFCLGYLLIALLIAPSLMWVLGVAPSYAAGVTLVLDRSGVLEPLQQAARQTEEFRDHVVLIADDYLSRRIIPHALAPRD